MREEPEDVSLPFSLFQIGRERQWDREWEVRGWTVGQERENRRMLENGGANSERLLLTSEPGSAKELQQCESRHETSRTDLKLKHTYLCLYNTHEIKE